MGLMAHKARALRAVFGTLAAALVVAACGGGSSRDTFHPTRLVVFGDQTSVICDGSDGACARGHKYTINALSTADGSFDCASNPIWVQVLASAYSFGFDQCQPSGITNKQAVIVAKNGAKAADLSGQIDGFVAGGDFAQTDLVTVLVGTNDIVEQYQAYSDPSLSKDAINAELATRGAAVAAQVNRIANAGGKVLAVTVPDVGLTPFAVAEEKLNPGRAALLKEFSASFNGALRLGLLNDGRKIGLVLGDELVQSLVTNAAAYALANVTDAACNLSLVPLQDCTASTLVTDPAGASASTWLWSSPLQLSPAGHSRLGSAALSRAQNNPF